MTGDWAGEEPSVVVLFDRFMRVMRHDFVALRLASVVAAHEQREQLVGSVVVDGRAARGILGRSRR